jgi:hypothetical protein
MLELAAAAAMWAVESKTDEMTDTVLTAAVVIGNGGRLALRCDAAGPKSVYAAFYSDTYLGGRGNYPASRNITLRFGKTDPIEGIATYMDSTAIIKGPEFAQAMRKIVPKVDKVIVRLVRYDGREVDMSFGTESSKDAIETMFKACEG